MTQKSRRNRLGGHSPQKFSWKVKAQIKPASGAIRFQEQCSSGGGGCGKCGSK